MPLFLLAYYRFTGTGIGSAFLNICPPAIIWWGISNASAAIRLFVWLMIFTINALFYGLAGAAIAFIVSPRKSE